MIGKLENKQENKLNQIGQQTEEYQYDAMDRYILSLRNFWRKNHLKRSYG
jgi:hypothetical protein